MISELIVGTLTNVFKSPSTFLKEWKSLLKTIGDLVSNRDDPDQYEFLEYNVNWEILDPTGHEAHLLKRLKVHFLQDGVRLLQDNMWWQEGVLLFYRCFPGEIIKTINEVDRWNSFILFKQAKNKGDVERLNIGAGFGNTFTHSEQGVQVELRHRTQHVRISVILPPQRHCHGAYINLRNQKQTIQLERDHFSILPDGRQMVTWGAEEIDPLEVIKLGFTW